jgi:hypothetical protein
MRAALISTVLRGGAVRRAGRSALALASRSAGDARGVAAGALSQSRGAAAAMYYSTKPTAPQRAAPDYSGHSREELLAVVAAHTRQPNPRNDGRVLAAIDALSTGDFIEGDVDWLAILTALRSASPCESGAGSMACGGAARAALRSMLCRRAEEERDSRRVVCGDVTKDAVTKTS